MPSVCLATPQGTPQGTPNGSGRVGVMPRINPTPRGSRKKGQNPTRPDPFDSLGEYLINIYFMGVHFIGVHFIGVHFIGIYLMGIYYGYTSYRRAPHRHIHLIGIYFISIYFTGIYFIYSF